MARAMVTQYGMSKKLGPLTFGDKEELIFLGRQISEQRNYSDEVAEQIDFEVRRLVDEAHDRALRILTDHRDKMDLIANKLKEEETLNAKEFAALIGEPIFSPEDSGGGSTPQKRTRTSGEDSSARRLPPSAAPLPA